LNSCSSGSDNRGLETAVEALRTVSLLQDDRERLQEEKMNIPRVATAACQVSLLCLIFSSTAGLAADPPAAGTPATPQPARPANRLAKESSPYLLLHAHNPVDWYPWGPEALERAKQENKPIFLSVGYSSCYWCHVMERQVFEHAEIARYMNEHFINIKVDREERPDLDDIYMLALQIYFQLAGSNQGGGWPLSMFLTPEGQPFAGGTYFPPEDRPGMPSFRRVLESIHSAWINHEQQVRGTAQLISREVVRLSKPEFLIEDTTLSRSLVEEAIHAVQQLHDPEFGGLDFDPDTPDGPKFPVASRLELLQSAALGKPTPESLAMVDLMLDRMAAGGIYDHLGNGFHRYSTDRRWRIPHFEKMLYDNAQLTLVYLDAFRRTNRLAYRQVVEGTLEFVTRDLTDPRGSFSSALDAETDGIEGKYYVWQPAEILAVLGERQGQLFMKAYGVGGPKDFEHGYILQLPKPLAALAEQLEMPLAELEQQLADARQRLLAARQQRPPLLKDDKVLTGWNGLMIQAYARSGQILQRKDLIQQAERAALEILATMRDSEGRLRRTARSGKAQLNAYLDDYAFLVAGLLALHEATRQEKWLNAARRLTDEQIQFFWDKQTGGFFFTTHDHETLIARTKSAYDGATPAGNSIAARNLVRLGVITGESKYREYAEQTLRTFVPQFRRNPASMSQLAIGIAEYLSAFGTETQLAAAPGAAAPKTNPPRPTPGTTGNAPPPTPQPARRTGTLVPGAQATAEELRQHPHLQATAYLAASGVPAGGSLPIAVVAQIGPGWHINAHPAQPDFVIPTQLNGQTARGGVLKQAVYPQGQPFRIEGFDEPVSVYEGQIVLRGILEIPAEAAPGADEVKITLRYQACNDQNCLRPLTLTLTGTVQILPTGAQAEAINQALFETGSSAAP
jgi:uncharacterized protein YyaL (SSP411 family)